MIMPSNKSLTGRTILCFVAVVGLFVATPAKSQESSRESSLSGEITSSTRNTLVVRGENGQYHLFVFDRDTVKPRTLPVGSTVRVISTPGDEAGVRVAS